MEQVKVEDEVRGVDAVLQRITTQVKTDAVIPLGERILYDGEHPYGVGIVDVGIPELNHSKVIPTWFAHRQIADHANIPWRYYRRMLE